MSQSTPKRRCCQFSLRTLLILTTLCAVLFGLCARWSQRARQQQALVATLRQAGVSAEYEFQDFENRPWTWPYERPPYWPKWLVDSLGVDYFAHVTALHTHNADAVVKNIEHFRQLPKLQTVLVGDASGEELDRLRQTLPHCEIVRGGLLAVYGAP